MAAVVIMQSRNQINVLRRAFFPKLLDAHFYKGI
jgi:hypothetical protein